MNIPRMCLLFVCVVASLLSITGTAASAEFFGLGHVHVPGSSGPDEAWAGDVTPDGSVAVGSAKFIGGGGRQPWRWTVESGMEALDCDDGWDCFAKTVSADGSVIYGETWKSMFVDEIFVDMSVPVRWNGTSEMEELELLPGYTFCRVWGASDDASVAVGKCTHIGSDWVAVRWTDNGIESLGVPDGFANSGAWEVSSDGSVIMVRADSPWWGAWLWTEQSGYEYLGAGMPTDITPDGSVVVGKIPHFLWTRETGYETLPFEGGYGPEVSPDGSAFFGAEALPLLPPTAYIQYADKERRDFRDLLISEYGLASELEGWVLEYVQETSADGLTVVGQGLNPDGVDEPWMVILDPPFQAGDADQDFDFDQLDLVAVQVAGKYLTGEPATWGEGDWNGAPVMFSTDPPEGDGLFNQLDIVAAQQAGLYMTGAYAGARNDSFVVVPEPSSLLLLLVGVAGLVRLFGVRVRPQRRRDWF